jgi:hypothetical protein
VLGGLLSSRSRRRGRDEYGVDRVSLSGTAIYLVFLPCSCRFSSSLENSGCRVSAFCPCELVCRELSVLMSLVLAPIYDRVDDEEEGGISPFFWRMRWRRWRKIRIFRSGVTWRRVRGECHRSELKRSGKVESCNAGRDVASVYRCVDSCTSR